MFIYKHKLFSGCQEIEERIVCLCVYSVYVYILYVCTYCMCIHGQRLRGLKVCGRSLNQGVWGCSPPEAIVYFHCNSTIHFFIQ